MLCFQSATLENKIVLCYPQQHYLFLSVGFKLFFLQCIAIFLNYNNQVQFCVWNLFAKYLNPTMTSMSIILRCTNTICAFCTIWSNDRTCLLSGMGALNQMHGAWGGGLVEITTKWKGRFYQFSVCMNMSSSTITCIEHQVPQNNLSIIPQQHEVWNFLIALNNAPIVLCSMQVFNYLVIEHLFGLNHN